MANSSAVRVLAWGVLKAVLFTDASSAPHVSRSHRAQVEIEIERLGFGEEAVGLGFLDGGEDLDELVREIVAHQLRGAEALERGKPVGRYRLLFRS